jgi:hypothetical protein
MTFANFNIPSPRSVPAASPTVLRQAQGGDTMPQAILAQPSKFVDPFRVSLVAMKQSRVS